MKKNEHPLRITAARVLEDWGMMMIDEPSSEGTQLFTLDTPLYHSIIELHGAVSGSVSIIAQEDFLSALAHNLLCEPEDVQLDSHQQEDAFRELGNVLAGNFITEAYGDDVVFDLLNPAVSTISPESLSAILERNVVFEFLVDGAPVAFTFNIQSK